MRFQLKQIAFAGLLACLGASAFASNYFFVQPKHSDMSKVAPFTLALGAATLPAAVRGEPYNTGAGYNLAQLATVSGDPALNQALVTFASGALPAGMLLSSAGMLSGTPTAVGSNLINVSASYKTATGAQNYTFTVTEPNGPVGQAVYTTPGAFNFIAPAGVTSVSVVAVGGGASGRNAYNAISSLSGGGGGLGWKNSITVIPGQSYVVRVGNGGARAENSLNSAGLPGGDSYFNNYSTVVGYGAAGFNGGGFTGSGGGAGATATTTSGGGGAGGYSGGGGTNTGGAGGNGSFGPANACSGGGGVGLSGQGASGAPLASNSASGGWGGSGGNPGRNSGPGWYVAGAGGEFGGGGGCTSDTFSGAGGGGAVRIIWGPGRAFPSTLTTNQ